MKLFVAVIAVFTLIEAAHLAYHNERQRVERDNCAKPQIFDKNF
jgi:hypothetical protein